MLEYGTRCLFCASTLHSAVCCRGRLQNFVSALLARSPVWGELIQSSIVIRSCKERTSCKEPAARSALLLQTAAILLPCAGLAPACHARWRACSPRAAGCSFPIAARCEPMNSTFPGAVRGPLFPIRHACPPAESAPAYCANQDGKSPPPFAVPLQACRQPSVFRCSSSDTLSLSTPTASAPGKRPRRRPMTSKCGT